MPLDGIRFDVGTPLIIGTDPNAGTESSINIAYVRTEIVGTLADVVTVLLITIEHVRTSLLGTITDVGTSLGETLSHTRTGTPVLGSWNW